MLLFVVLATCFIADSPIYAQTAEAGPRLPLLADVGGLRQAGAREITTCFSAKEILTWPYGKVNGTDCRVSPTLAAPAGYEVNHHRVIVNFVGSGIVKLSVAHSTSNRLDKAVENKRLHSTFRTLESSREVTVTSGQTSERYAWLILQTIGDVHISEIRYSFWRGRGTLAGHVARTFEFAGARLPYRLMYPRNYDPRKAYPLVLSVSGSGGVGTDNIRNMEKVILARYLFLNYFHDAKLQCFSLVPQIPPKSVIPRPYWPAGTLGRPTPIFHPDCAVVNEQGWYVQAALALIQNLIDDTTINIDKDRIYCSGFSYGGKACWEFLKAAPNFFAAAACGAGWAVGRPYSDPNDSPELLKQLKTEVQRYKHVPVHIFAGDQDHMRFAGRAVHRQIIAAGGNSTYIEFPRTNHVATAGRAWGRRKHIEWFFAQNRRNNPKPLKSPLAAGWGKRPPNKVLPAPSTQSPVHLR